MSSGDGSQGSPNGADGRVLPSVSVIIPLYNGRVWLERAIASAQAQLYPPALLQIVVVDDGSSDGSAELADQLSLADPRILVLRQANAGPAAARNTAIEASNGELIAFLDCDDTWEPSKLARQVQMLLADPKLGVIHCGTRFVDAAGQPVNDWVRRSRTEHGEVLLEYFCDFFLITSALLVPRRCLDAVGLFDPSLRIGEDHELFLRLLNRYPLGCVDKQLLNRTIRPDSLSRQDFDLDAHNDLMIMDRFRWAEPDFAQANRVRIANRYADYLYNYGYDLLKHGQSERARTTLLRSLGWRFSMRALRALVRSVLPAQAARNLRAA